MWWWSWFNMDGAWRLILACLAGTLIVLLFAFVLWRLCRSSKNEDAAEDAEVSENVADIKKANKEMQLAEAPVRTMAGKVLEDKMKVQIIDYLKTHLPPGYKIVRQGQTESPEVLTPKEIKFSLKKEVEL